MELHINLAVVMHDWSRRHGLAGPTLTLGVQDVCFTRTEYAAALAPPHSTSRQTAESAPPTPAPSMSARELFEVLGLGPLAALDVGDYDGADIIFDLNEPQPPTETRQHFGLIVNGGTLEHVFHVPNALANLNAMLTPGGAILHVLPCNNWVNHGFYQFSPTLMFDYYAALRFELIESAMMIFNARAQGGHHWEIRPAPIGSFAPGVARSLDDRTYLHVVLVRRDPESLERALPVQSRYAGRFARPKGGPRWFSPYDLSYGTRIDHPNRQIIPLTGFQKGEGLSWTVQIPALKVYADDIENPARSSLVVLEDGCPLGPPHASHASIRARGGGEFSHWGKDLVLSTSDDSDPNENGRSYVAILPHP